MLTVTASRKQKLSATEESITNCNFCGEVPAAVSVQMPTLFRKRRSPFAYCLPCYYTTSAVRQEPSKYVSICNQEQLTEQLVPMQQLFSEAFLDLQNQLQGEADLAYSSQKSDPLAMLHNASVSAPRRANHRAPKAGAQKKKEGDLDDGGFLRQVPLPERLLRTQKEQARLQKAQIARLNQLAEGAEERSEAASVYQRRKSSKKSIWNLAMDTNATSEPKEKEVIELTPRCTCGSNNVQAFGNITSRNQDLKKGETWGMKDRGDDVVSRYQCNSCGKMWNEEG